MNTYTKMLGGSVLVAPGFSPAFLAFRAWSRYGDCRASATACGSKVLGEMSNQLLVLSRPKKAVRITAFFRHK